MPLPSTFYQNFAYRIYYNEHFGRHTQFGNDFIYAFTWEDSQTDRLLLNIGPEDSVLCLTSASDNLLDYLYSCSPRRIYAADINPNQAHLLELKVAAYQALDYGDFWKIFGRGSFPAIRDVLLQKMSPYMSSQSLQFWLERESIFTSSAGLYLHGGSGRVTKLVRLLLRFSGLRRTTKRFCEAKTIAEQQELWLRLRRVLLCRALHWLLIGPSFLWKATGVPREQADMIVDDYNECSEAPEFGMRNDANRAIWQYVCSTLEPVVRETLISKDNFYYLLPLNGCYTRR